MKKKECPSCAMEIDRNSKHCPVCNYEFPSTSPSLKWAALLLALLFLIYLLVF
jgi:RNA polymerase subunit RPABC4/transcription elongation factor Spt4